MKEVWRHMSRTNRMNRELWEAFVREPGEATFAPFYEASRRLVYTICLRVLRDEEDALDAYQTAYARLLAAARAGQDEFGEDATRRVTRTAVREADSLRKRRGRRARKARPRWLMWFFSSGVSWAMVRSSPWGTKMGS